VDLDAELKGEENEIAFNAKYLLDLLSNLSEDQLVFDMIGPLNPGVFRIKGDASFLHLIMPIRTEQ
jgi:DNA polymerase-3 subunit beta